MKKTNLRQYLFTKYGKRELEILAKFSSQKMKYITQGKK